MIVLVSRRLVTVQLSDGSNHSIRRQHLTGMADDRYRQAVRDWLTRYVFPSEYESSWLDELRAQVFAVIFPPAEPA